MSKKELIVTDTIWYKIYNFFRKIFSKNKYQDNENNVIQKKQENHDFVQNISYRNKITSLNRKKELAENLMSGKLAIMDLSDDEVDEMIEYFNVYINEMNQKLDKIKKFIIDLKNKK